LAEGFSSHMWDWYTGYIIWKTQNPWTAMRGQMYDYYLDPNACLYGLKHGAEALHVMYNPLNGMVTIVNNSFETKRDLMLVIKTVDIDGKEKVITQLFEEIQPSSVKGYAAIKNAVSAAAEKQGAFLSLQLFNVHQNTVSNNFYWLPDAQGVYSGLKAMPPSWLKIVAKQLSAGKIQVSLTNPANAPVAFFNRLSLVNAQTKNRLLPVFYSDNYISLLPGEHQLIIMDYDAGKYKNLPLLSISGWNLKEQLLDIKQ